MSEHHRNNRQFQNYTDATVQNDEKNQKKHKTYHIEENTRYVALKNPSGFSKFLSESVSVELTTVLRILSVLQADGPDDVDVGTPVAIIIVH